MEPNFNDNHAQETSFTSGNQAGVNIINISQFQRIKNNDIQNDLGKRIVNPDNIIRQNTGEFKDNKILIWKAYLSRSNGSDIEFLVSLTDFQHKRMCKWMSVNDLRNYDNFFQQINYVNRQNAQNEFLNVISRKLELSPLEKIEILSKDKNEYLFKYNYNGCGLFFWDNPKNENLIELTQKFDQRELNLLNEKKPLNESECNELNDDLKFLRGLKQDESCIFMGEKSNVSTFLSSFNGSALIITEDEQYKSWCELLELNKIRFAGYNGDKFTRAMKRQYQLKSNMIILANYKAMFKDFMFFDDNFDLLVIDNAQKIKNINGRRYNIISSIKYKSCIFIASVLTLNFHNIWKGISKNSGKTYFGKTSYITKHIFLLPTENQLELYKKNINDRLKISNHCLLIDGIEILFQDFDRHQLLLNLSSKFIFMLEIVKRVKTDECIYVHSKSKRFLSLFEELCKFENIRTKYLDKEENNDLNPNVILCNNPPKSGVIYSFDTELPNSYRLVTYGTIEHRLLSEASLLRNVYNEPIYSIPVPKKIDKTFEYDIIEHKFFDFTPLIQENENIFETTKQAIMHLCKFGYSGKNQYETFIVLSLLRAINPAKISEFPLLLQKLIPNIPNCNLSLAICNNKKMWVKPLKHLFSNFELSGIKMIREHIFHSAEHILLKIEHRHIVLIFKQYFNEFKFQSLKDYDNSDIQLVSSLMEGIEPINKEKRINEIISFMKSEILLINSTDRFILPFWTKYEIKHVINTISNFGASLVSQNPTLFHSKTRILSKSTYDISDLVSKILTLLSSQINYNPISLNLIVPSEYLLNGIVNDYLIEPDIVYELKLHINQNLKVKNLFEYYKTQSPFDNINYELTNASCLVFFSFITKFGLLNRERYVMSPSFLPSKNLTQTEINILNGKHPIYPKETQSLFPFYLVNDYQFQLFLERISCFKVNDVKINEGTNIQKPNENIFYPNLLKQNKLQENEITHFYMPQKFSDHNAIKIVPPSPYQIQASHFPKNQQLNSISLSETNKQSQIRASQETARRMTEDFLRTLPHRARSSKDTNSIDVSIQKPLPNPIICNNTQERIINQTSYPVTHEKNMIPNIVYQQQQLNIPLPLKKQYIPNINNAIKGS